MFVLDRIKMLRMTSEFFTRLPDYSLEDYLGSSLGVMRGEEVKARIWISPDYARYVSEKIWHSSQRLKSQPDGSLHLEFRIAGTEEVKSWVLGLGRHARVLEPDSLAREVADEAARVTASYHLVARAEERGKTD